MTELNWYNRLQEWHLRRLYRVESTLFKVLFDLHYRPTSPAQAAVSLAQIAPNQDEITQQDSLTHY